MVSVRFAVVKFFAKAVGVRDAPSEALGWSHALQRLPLTLSFVMLGFSPSSGAANLTVRLALLRCSTPFLTLLRCSTPFLTLLRCSTSFLTLTGRSS